MWLNVQYTCQLIETCFIKLWLGIEKFTGYSSAVMNCNKENVFLSEILIGRIKNKLNPIKKIKADTRPKTTENKLLQTYARLLRLCLFLNRATYKWSAAKAVFDDTAVSQQSKCCQFVDLTITQNSFEITFDLLKVQPVGWAIIGDLAKKMWHARWTMNKQLIISMS